MTDDIVTEPIFELWDRLPITSTSLDQIAPALCAAQGDIEHAIKDSDNPHFKSKYADLAGVIDAYRPRLKKHGLALLQLPLPSDDQGVRLQTVILHTSGQWIADGAPVIPAAKNDAQAYGSAMTYARRYHSAAMIGVAQDDDDGNAATQRMPAKRVPSVKLAPAGERKELEQRIGALEEHHRSRIATQLRERGVAWTQLTKPQFDMVVALVEACEAAADTVPEHDPED